MFLSELTNKEKPILFGLPFPIDFSDQVKILDYVYSHTNDWSGQVQVWSNKKNTYDPGEKYFGRIHITKLTDESIKKISHVEGLNSNWINWAARLDSNLEWEWIDTPITPIIKKYVNRISHLYVKFNRVLILIQKIGEEIPLHTDKVSKNTYMNELFAPGPVKELKITENDYHIKNRYLALKWTISEKENDKGNPVIKYNNILYRYDPKHNLFAINEVDIEHGAKKTSHMRGVIFLDGILNYDNILKEKWTDIELEKL